MFSGIGKTVNRQEEEQSRKLNFHSPNVHTAGLCGAVRVQLCRKQQWTARGAPAALSAVGNARRTLVGWKDGKGHVSRREGHATESLKEGLEGAVSRPYGTPSWLASLLMYSLAHPCTHGHTEWVYIHESDHIQNQASCTTVINKTLVHRSLMNRVTNHLLCCFSNLACRPNPRPSPAIWLQYVWGRTQASVFLYKLHMHDQRRAFQSLLGSTPGRPECFCL